MSTSGEFRRLCRKFRETGAVGVSAGAGVTAVVMMSDRVIFAKKEGRTVRRY
jgi:hypothetical protein